MSILIRPKQIDYCAGKIFLHLAGKSRGRSFTHRRNASKEETPGSDW